MEPQHQQFGLVLNKFNASHSHAVVQPDVVGLGTLVEGLAYLRVVGVHQTGEAGTDGVVGPDQGVAHLLPKY